MHPFPKKGRDAPLPKREGCTPSQTIFQEGVHRFFWEGVHPSLFLGRGAPLQSIFQEGVYLSQTFFRKGCTSSFFIFQEEVYTSLFLGRGAPLPEKLFGKGCTPPFFWEGVHLSLLGRGAPLPFGKGCTTPFFWEGVHPFPKGRVHPFPNNF